MFDTHAHLNCQEYQGQVEKIVGESKKAGVTGIIIASSNLEDSQQAIDLAKKYPGYLYASVGIHPHCTDRNFQFSIYEQINQLENLISECKKHIVAVGETGLDDSEPLSPEKKRSVEEQKELFSGQLGMAAKYDLPVIIHARGLVDEVINSIQHSAFGLKLNGTFHCYAGGKKRIAKILDLPGNWYFGIDGNVTYDQGLQNVVSQIPRDRLVLETDSPYLTPEPYRDRINSPAYLPLIAKQVAQIWGVDQKEVVKITIENSQRLFKL